MHGRRVGLIGLACLAVTWGAPAAASAWTSQANPGPRGDQHIDYPAYSSTERTAPSMTVNSVGDVNGDGADDIGAGFQGYPYTDERVHITFSQQLAGVGAGTGLGGFTIKTSWLWFGLASAGDVNGDGLGDVAIKHNDSVDVVFGKADGGEVDTASLGAGGFSITGVGAFKASGYDSEGVVPLGDLNGDGVGELLLQARGDAAIVYPPRAAAGMTIDASVPGPYVTTLRATGDRALEEAFVGNLGDQDGDGRDDVLVAGDEIGSIDQRAYGVLAPQPGTAVDLAKVADQGRGFELVVHDGRGPGRAWGELQQALTLGDQNGDGRRDVGVVTAPPEQDRLLRVVYSPPPGTRLDVGDLVADARGYAWHPYGDVVDMGDQNGDGVGDFATGRYVYFANPPLETGTREAVYDGFYFLLPNDGAVVAPLRDLNGDGRPEIVLGTTVATRTGPEGSSGEDATYSVDVFDSARAPEVPLPEAPMVLPSGKLQVPVEFSTGAGTDGGGSLAVEAVLQLSPGPGGRTLTAQTGMVPSGGPRKRVALELPISTPLGGWSITPGQQFSVRYSVRNSRGQGADGPWRTFIFQPPPKVPAPLKTRVFRGTSRGDRITGSIGPDRMSGLAGDDVLDGRPGDDVLDGSTGRDRLLGGKGADLLRGGKGDDRLDGGPGKDVLDGGSGDDRLDARDGEKDVVRCGDGRDAVRADRIDKLVSCERRLR